jgi:polyisoprenoid-binding protein YceI
MRSKMSLFVLSILLLTQPAFTATYKVDPDHSAVTFKIRHLFSQVQGTFNKYEGTIEYEPGKPETWSAAGTIDVDSINTNVPNRDKHLKSPDFFDVAKYPTITFKTTKVTAESDTKAKVQGVMTMHGVEKPIELDVEIHGVGKDPWGNVRAGFTATTKINRKDFGIDYNAPLETGQLMLGEEVAITIEAEGILDEGKQTT